ncbi:hypothetical protein Gasu2_46310 [Galdieria sulphuraria]|nr:hypothetical protein Gasu2_46310 [Galdieria sulphuraria]
MNRLSHQRPIGKKQARGHSKPDLSTIEGSRQFILQHDKKKKKKTHDSLPKSDFVQVQSQTEDITPTHKYRDRAQERRERTGTTRYDENDTLVIGIAHFDKQETPSKVQAPTEELNNNSAQEQWPSLVSQIAVLQFRKEETPTPTGVHRVDSFYPGRMYYVYELAKHGLNESNQPLVVRHSKKRIFPSNSITYEWSRDIASSIWTKDTRKKLSSFKEDAFPYNNGEPGRIHLFWNCKEPSQRDISPAVDETDDTTAVDKDASKMSSVWQVDGALAGAVEVENETTKHFHYPSIQNENESQEEEMDIFQDIDSTQVTWSYSKNET